MKQDITIETKSYARCQRDHKRVAQFNQHGLLAWCKICHVEILVSWSELEQIRKSLQEQKVS